MDKSLRIALSVIAVNLIFSHAGLVLLRIILVAITGDRGDVPGELMRLGLIWLFNPNAIGVNLISGIIISIGLLYLERDPDVEHISRKIVFLTFCIVNPVIYSLSQIASMASIQATLFLTLLCLLSSAGAGQLVFSEIARINRGSNESKANQ